MDKEEFFNLCCDCLYYGYFWGFIKEEYKNAIDSLTESVARDIYNKAFNYCAEC